MDEQTANKCEHVVALLSEIPTMSDVPRALPFDAPTPLQDRLSKVLDAFANLLVSQPRREVIAVGMQIFTSTDTTKYAIVIGSNSSIPEDTVSHCRAIVSQLQDLGHHFYHMRKASYDNPAVIEMESERSRSPPLDETSFTPEVRSLVRKLKTQIHDFSLPKLKQRLNKPSGNGTRITAFQEYVSKLPDSENTTIVILKRIATILSFVSTFLGNQNSSLDTTTPDSLRFIEGMDRVCDMVQELFQTETWMIRLSAIASEPTFPLDRFLRKITSVPNAIDTLIHAAHSPRLYRRCFAEGGINVLALSNEKQKVKIPSADEWSEVARAVLKDSRALSLTDEPEQRPGRLLKPRFNTVSVVSAPVHCECLVALYLLRESHRLSHAVRYIGVSKLSCLACCAFLDSLRNHGIAFNTKGCHGKAYFPWKFPITDLQNADLDDSKASAITESFLSIVTSLYSNRLIESDRERKLSDSSAGSSEETKRHFEIKWDFD